MDFSKLSEAQLWKKIAQGDDAAFEFAYEKFSDGLFRYGQKITKDRELIEDTIHDVFLLLWENRKTVTIFNSLKFYLLKSFKRALIRKINETRETRPSTSQEPDRIWESSIQELLLENQIILESNENVKNAINNLSARQREAVFLRYMEGLPYEEVARLMDMQVSSLYNLVQKALKNLGEFLVNKQTYIKSFLILIYWSSR
ncbi:RNA polymerase sigma factor [Negadavirga shengliensis]|uniref:RNA polymerase sigma factor n=1 Tax=Negadavirga shengliensis TaxID=1389218 RepID=A0ABV9T414_9BACT